MWRGLRCVTTRSPGLKSRTEWPTARTVPEPSEQGTIGGLAEIWDMDPKLFISGVGLAKHNSDVSCLVFQNIGNETSFEELTSLTDWNFAAGKIHITVVEGHSFYLDEDLMGSEFRRGFEGLSGEFESWEGCVRRRVEAGDDPRGC